MLRVLFDADSPVEAAYLAASNPGSQSFLDESRQNLREKFGTLSAAETIVLTKTAAQLTGKALKKKPNQSENGSNKIDRLMLHPVLGPILLVLIMLTVFQSIFSWAEPFINWIDFAFSSLANWVGSGMSEGPLRSLITDGIIGGVGAVLVFVPQIAILFLFIALLEDSGYMSRAAFLVDRMFRWCGLSGKSFIPLLSSFACAIPGIMATRTIEDRKLRLMTITVAPLMSCSARLPVYTILIAAFIPYERIFGPINLQGLILTGLYAIGIVVAIIVSFILKKTILKTETGSFLMEMPGYKVPTLKSVGIRVFSRVRTFVTRAGTVIMAIAIVIWALSYFPRSEFIENKYDGMESTVQERYNRLWPFHNSEIMSLVVTDPGLEGINSDLTERLATAEDRGAVLQIASSLPQPTGSPQEVRAERELINQLIERRSVEIAYQTDLSRLANQRAGENLAASYFGQLGRLVAPLFKPLGWDWKISMAVLASFPAREVVIATLGTIYNLGSEVDEQSSSLVDKMRKARWDDGEKTGQPVFTPAVAMSVMVFFALCCQCGATLVTIRQETGGNLYPLAVFGYMTLLAYLGAWAVFNLMKWVWY
ncbi:MAG: ferrous iron transporter B [bacterium]|nr:ferrous iron transporter B [bacterium]